MRLASLLCLLALAPAPSWAAIAVGAVPAAATAAGSTVSTAGVTTTASGSTFYIACIVKLGSAPTVSASDNKGNTYTQIASQLYDGNGQYLDRFYAWNATGGSGHTFSCSGGSTGNIAIYALEITGAATTASPLDQSSTATTGFNGAPYSTGSVTITPPAQGEMLVTPFSTNASTNPIVFTLTPSPLTIESSLTAGGGNTPTGALGAGVETSNGTYSGSWSDASGSFVIAVMDSFKGGSGGGGSCTHAGLTQGGAETVPTAGSTLVWLKSGSFGMVDCSSTPYWQPALGNFGVN